MNVWKKTVIDHINHKEKYRDYCDEKSDNAKTDLIRSNWERRSDRADYFVDGALTVLNDMGYSVRREDGVITDIIGDRKNQYRIRYRTPKGIIRAAICYTEKEVQAMMDCLKINDNYIILGIDTRTVDDGIYDLSENWIKIFDC